MTDEFGTRFAEVMVEALPVSDDAKAAIRTLVKEGACMWQEHRELKAEEERMEAYTPAVGRDAHAWLERACIERACEAVAHLRGVMKIAEEMGASPDEMEAIVRRHLAARALDDSKLAVTLLQMGEFAGRGLDS